MRMVISVNVQERKDQVRTRNVVRYHVQNGLWVSGQSVPNRVVVEVRLEMLYA